MENEIKTTESKAIESEKDEVLVKLEHMLKNTPESSRQPILNLINKRKVELGLMKSGLPPAGYKLKKTRTKPKHSSNGKKDFPNKESLNKIAKSVGKISETVNTIPQDIDIRNEPLKKNKKAIEEFDSYKY